MANCASAPKTTAAAHGVQDKCRGECSEQEPQKCVAGLKFLAPLGEVEGTGDLVVGSNVVLQTC